jgi:hypothetical protein
MKNTFLCTGQFLSGTGLGISIVKLCGCAINPFIGLGLALAGLGLTLGAWFI